MADHVFYEAKRKANTRAVVIKGARLLPGRAPSNNKRIVIPVVMPLSNQKTTGQPDWISDAHAFVARSGDPVNPLLKLNGFDIDFATENRNLFNDEKISTQKCNMRSFSIHGQGSEEEPDIVMSFTIYAPFSTALWDYLGQVSNDDVWARFTPSAAPPEDDDQDDLELSGEGEDEEDIEDQDGAEDEGTDNDTESEE